MIRLHSHLKSCRPKIPVIILLCVVYLYFCCPALAGSNVSNVNSIIQCPAREREALLQFKHGIKNDYCSLLTSWGGNADCCQWRGVLCSNHTGHVITLRLVGKAFDMECLEGKVSPSLGELKHLTHLNLSFNDFSQPIPSFLGSLENLELLSLSYSFKGDIPHQLGNLTKLKTLELASDIDLYVNSLQKLQWLSRLTLLRYLDLSGVDLSKATNWMQIVSNLPFLSVLNLQSCGLSAKIPSSLTYINSSTALVSINLALNIFNDTSIYQWLFNLPGINTQLVYLDLSVNELQGPIPNGLGNMQHLLHLDLSSNHLEGPMLSEFQNMHSLTYLALSDNSFRGSVFKIFSKLCNLERVYLRSNNFTDELTDVIQALNSCRNKALLSLDLSHNLFWGAIPDSISSFSSLKELHLDGNQLTGNVAQSVGQLARLEKLDLSSNILEGTLTHRHFINLSRLRELYLSDNSRLVIDIDPSWNPPFQLDIIHLRSCKLGPYFPKWLQVQTNFSYLDVSNAEISDSIPVSFWNSWSFNLKYLNMSYNQLSGLLPNLSQKVYISPEVVDLSSNLFEGAVPSGFTNTEALYLNDNRFSDSSDILCPKILSNLFELDLSNNLLSGELQDHCWKNLSFLSSLHLENNRFSGNIPNSIGTLSFLRYLHLYNNSFSGPIPDSIKNCTFLAILNLGYNSLTGNIPTWMDNTFSGLGALVLRKNRFVGEIPVSLCELANLQILDLAINNISGVIPNCISNFTAMSGQTDFSLSFIHPFFPPSEEESAIISWKRDEQRFKETVRLVKFIDFSSNELSGEIPDEISCLTGLGSLDLSKNNLSGSIVSEIGELTALQLLDLSNNHLTGVIPASLAKVSSLGILDLSNNNLSGEIPLSTQLQSFNASSYAGNPGLCGAPLPNCSTNREPVTVLNGDNNNVRDSKHDEYGIFPGLYISVVLGFIIGFWGVCGTLVIKQSWRHAYFRLLERVYDRLYEIATAIIDKGVWRRP